MASLTILNQGSSTNITGLSPVTGLVSAVDEVMIYDASAAGNRKATVLELVPPAPSGYIPPGGITVFAMSSPPVGWLSCDGSAISRVTYAGLFAAIGTVYGTGDGSSTFNLPDLRGYFLRGAGTNSDGTVSGTFGERVADTFKSHYHIENYSYNAGAIYAPGGLGGTWAGTSGATSSAGDAETRPRNVAMLFCVKY